MKDKEIKENMVLRETDNFTTEREIRIDRMSKFLLKRQELTDRLEELLDELDGGREEFEELKDYLSSEQRMLDLDADENGEIPENINRAVLSQDELYNLLEANHEAAIHMMESAVDMLK